MNKWEQYEQAKKQIVANDYADYERQVKAIIRRLSI
jgi:hypothetical protein